MRDADEGESGIEDRVLRDERRRRRDGERGREMKSKERRIDRRQEDGAKGRVRKLANVLPPTGGRCFVASSSLSLP